MVISPISSSLLGIGPVAYPLVMGDINLVKLLKILKPKVCVRALALVFMCVGVCMLVHACKGRQGSLCC